MKRKAALDYEKEHKGQFVVIRKADSTKIIGIFEYVTPDFNLYIKGKYASWRVDPFDIKEFYARPDRFGGDQD